MSSRAGCSEPPGWPSPARTRSSTSSCGLNSPADGRKIPPFPAGNPPAPAPTIPPSRAAMKKCALITAVFLGWMASEASAGGIYLAWSDCLGAGGAHNRTFACDSKAGSSNMFISFDPPEDIPDVNGSNPIIDIQSASTPLPEWWKFKNAGTCRRTSLSALSVSTGTCPDAWAGAGVAGIAAYLETSVLPSIGLNRARLLGSISVPTSMAQAVHPGTEYTCMQIRINNARTIGNVCPGCTDPVCLVLMEVLLTTNENGDFRLISDFRDNYCLWQGGDIGGVGCPLATPTVNRTWGQLKAIYR